MRKIKVDIPTDIYVEETDTQGNDEYLVALSCGGLMESPGADYTDYQIIRANSEVEAKDKYDTINKCSYFYGETIKKLS